MKFILKLVMTSFLYSLPDYFQLVYRHLSDDLAVGPFAKIVIQYGENTAFLLALPHFRIIILLLKLYHF